MFLKKDIRFFRLLIKPLNSYNSISCNLFKKHCFGACLPHVGLKYKNIAKKTVFLVKYLKLEEQAVE